MTREEEKNVAASKYIEDNSMTDGYISISDYKDSFIEGADWADSHPVNVWHDVSEEPKYGEWFIAQIGDDAFDTFVMAMSKNQDWKEWVNGINIKRWAYISDLLPKGGKK